MGIQQLLLGSGGFAAPIWRAAPNAPINNTIAAAVGAGYFIGVSDIPAGGVLISSDGGNTWSSNTNSSADPNWSCMAYGNPSGTDTWVALGSTGLVQYTTNYGVSWTVSGPIAAVAFRDIVWVSSLGLFVGVAQTGTNFYTSPTGASWTARAMSLTAAGSVTFDPVLGKLCAFSTSAGTNLLQAATSSDAITFTNQATPTGVKNYQGGAGRLNGGGFIANDISSANCLRSTDGTTFSLISSGTGAIGRLAHVSGYLIGLGTNRQTYSRDNGTTWVDQSLTTSGAFLWACGDKGKFFLGMRGSPYIFLGHL